MKYSSAKYLRNNFVDYGNTHVELQRAFFRGGRSHFLWYKLSECHLSRFKINLRVAIPSGSYRAQKPPKAGNTKKIRKNYKVPHPGLGHANTKNYRKNTNWSFSGHFCIFFGNFFVSRRGKPWKLTVKKIVNNKMFFFTVYVPYKPWKTLRKPWKIGTKIHHCFHR